MSKKKKQKKVKNKRKLSPAEKAAKKERQKKYMTVFMHGKQKRVLRPETIDGMFVEDWIELNADPIWLHQHGYHEVLFAREQEERQREEQEAWEQEARAIEMRQKEAWEYEVREQEERQREAREAWEQEAYDESIPDPF